MDIVCRSFFDMLLLKDMSKKDQLELVLVSQPDWLGTQISCKAELQLKKNPWVVVVVVAVLVMLVSN